MAAKTAALCFSGRLNGKDSTNAIPRNLQSGDFKSIELIYEQHHDFLTDLIALA